MGYTVYLIDGTVGPAVLVGGTVPLWLGLLWALYKQPHYVDAIGRAFYYFFAIILLMRMWRVYSDTMLTTPALGTTAPVLLLVPILFLSAFVLLPRKEGLKVAVLTWLVLCLGAIKFGWQMQQEEPPRQFMPALWVQFFLTMPIMIFLMNVMRAYAAALTEATESIDIKNQQLDEMQVLAYQDYLTGLSNRRYFERKLDEAWDEARNQQSRVGLVFIDVDHFKAFNDHAGHDAGDDCLVEISRNLKASLGNSGWLLARFGGEEFCVLAADCDDNQLAEMGEKLRYCLWENNIPHPSEACERVTISVGAASALPARDADMRSLLRRADQALYQAKAAGRNQCIIAVPEHESDMISV